MWDSRKIKRLLVPILNAVFIAEVIKEKSGVLNPAILGSEINAAIDGSEPDRLNFALKYFSREFMKSIWIGEAEDFGAAYNRAMKSAGLWPFKLDELVL